MFCPHCGSAIPDNSTTCPNCNADLTSENTPTIDDNATDGSTSEPDATPAETDTVDASTSDEAVEANASDDTAAKDTPPDPSSSNPAPSATMPAPTTPAPSAKGPVAQAWDDISESPHWLRRTLLLMVMQAIPVVGFWATGHNLTWGAQAAQGRREQLPTHSIFGWPEFKYGLLQFILAALYATTMGVFAIIGLIPLIGWIIALAAAILCPPILALASLRLRATGKLSSAFELSHIIEVYRRAPGALIACQLLPAIIVGAILFLILAILGLGSCTTVAGFSQPFPFNTYGFGVGYSALGALLAGGLGVGFIAFLILAAAGHGLIQLWQFRATGIWIYQHAPEWASVDSLSASATGATSAPTSHPTEAGPVPPYSAE